MNENHLFLFFGNGYVGQSDILVGVDERALFKYFKIHAEFVRIAAHTRKSNRVERLYLVAERYAKRSAGGIYRNSSAYMKKRDGISSYRAVVGKDYLSVRRRLNGSVAAVSQKFYSAVEKTYVASKRGTVFVSAFVSASYVICVKIFRIKREVEL